MNQKYHHQPSSQLPLSQKDAHISTVLHRTLQFKELSNQPKNKTYLLSEMTSNQDRLRSRLNSPNSQFLLVSSHNLSFHTITQETMMERIFPPRDNSNQRNFPRNPVLMISCLQIKSYIQMEILKSIMKQLLNMSHTLETQKKLWMNICQKSSWEDNTLLSCTMFVKILSQLLQLFQI